MVNMQGIDQQRPKRDIVLWILIVILLGAGIGVYYYFSQIAWALRATGALVLVCILVAIASQTTQGKQVWKFSKEARVELRKVIWPTRQETIQTTMVIVAMVIVMALILWGVDSVLMWAVSWFSGQRG